MVSVKQGWASGAMNKRCEICGASEFTFEVGLTKFTSREEAERVLGEEEQKQLQTRAALMAVRAKAAEN